MRINIILPCHLGMMASWRGSLECEASYRASWNCMPFIDRNKRQKLFVLILRLSVKISVEMCALAMGIQWIDLLQLLWHHIDGLVQDCSNSSVLAMELLQFYAKPLIWHHGASISRLTVCSIVHANNKENINDLHCRAIMRRIHNWFTQIS